MDTLNRINASFLKFFVLTLIGTIGLNFSAFAGWDEGVAAFMQNDFGTAVKEFKAFTEKNPNSDKGHYMLGLSLEKRNQPAKGLHHLRKAYDLNPNDLSINVALARSLCNNENFSAANKVLSKGNTFSPGTKGISAELGAGLYAKNELATAHYLYGISSLKLGKKEVGLKALKAAAEQAPNNKKFQKAYKAAQ